MANTVWANPKPQRIQQINPSTCWLASCQMLYQWKGLDVGDVEKNLKNSDDDRVDWDTWYRAGLDHDDTVPLAKALGFKWGAGGELTLKQIADAIQRFGPLLAIGAWNTNSHVIVVAGLDVPSDSKYDSVSKIYVLNPWFNSDNPEERNLFWFNGGLGHWKGINGQYMHW
jgi:hypothetical protein